MLNLLRFVKSSGNVWGGSCQVVHDAEIQQYHRPGSSRLGEDDPRRPDVLEA